MKRPLFAFVVGAGAALFLLAGFALLARPVQAAGFVVDDTGDAGDALPGDAFCATAGGVCTLRAAIEESNALAGPDQITFAGSVSGTIVLAQTLVVSDDLTITGPGASTLSLSGGGTVRLFDLLPGNTVEIGFLTLASGASNGNGAGIYNEAALTLTRVDLENHLAPAGRGAALYNAGGTVAINAGTIRLNQALSGGGVANQDGAMRIEGTLFTRNSVSRNGAAIFQEGISATLVVTNGATIDGNSANAGGSQGYGGGAYIQSGSAGFVDVDLSGNVARNGGGIYSRGDLVIRHSLIDGNTAELGGGGVFAGPGAGSQSLILDSEIANNRVLTDTIFTTYGGGGLRLDAPYNVARRLNVHHNSAGYDGGGVGIWFGTAYLEEIDFSHNDAGFKGGGLANYGHTTLVASTLYSNTAQAGSAILNEANYGPELFAGPGDLLIHATTIISNVSSYYAGAIGNGGKLDMYDSLVQGNTVGQTNNGGGFSNFPGGIAGIYNSAFVANIAGQWGGAIVNGDTMTVTNSTFSGNQAQRGGAAALFGGDYQQTSTTFNHVTVHDNTATQGIGGGLWQETITNSVRVNNSIVAGNSGGDCDVVDLTVSPGPQNLDGDGSCEDFNLTGNPLLAALADNGGPTPTHALGVGSPALDVANNNQCHFSAANGLDQRGVLRPNGACDLGAFERSDGFVCALPDPVADLGIELNSGVVSLGWSSSPDAGLYHIMREGQPYFTPDALYGLTALNSWDDPDPNAAGDPEANHYYVVLPATPCGEAAVGGRVGVFNFALTPGS